MKRKLLSKLFILLLIFCSSSITVRSQTALVAGDIAFTGYYSSGSNGTDTVCFVLLKTIVNNTQIKFTDKGWVTPSSALLGSESVYTYTNNTGGDLVAGTEICLAGLTATRVSNGASAGTYVNTVGTVTTGISLSNNGDQILAYQGTEASPTFIAGLHMNVDVAPSSFTTTTTAQWEGADTDPAHYGTSQSGMPPGLSAGFSALWIGVQGDFNSEYENAFFNCSGDLTSVATLRTAIYNQANWTKFDGASASYTVRSRCTFLAGPVAPVISGHPSAVTSCGSLPATFTAGATGSALNYQWEEATNAAFTTGLTTLTTVSGIYTNVTTNTLGITDISGLNGRYYRLKVTNAGGTVYTSGALLTVTASSLPTIATNISQAVGANSNTYQSGTCRILAKVIPIAPTPVTGTIDATVWIEPGPSVPTYNGAPFVARHYEIAPATNAANATARVTLYFSQAEFTSFNNDPASNLDLPSGPADGTGIGYLRVSKFPGVSSGSGLPGSYSGTPSIINPVDADIKWETINNRWAVTFDVAGFSGFFVHTGNNPIPVVLSSFTGKMNSSRSATLQWKVEEQVNIDKYIIERSNDGTSFSPVATVTANNFTSYTYTAADNTVQVGKNYYRLKITEKNGQSTYSNTILLSTKGGSVIAIYPNPVKAKVTVQFALDAPAGVIKITDMLGRVLQQVPSSPGTTKTLDMKDYSKGIYLLEAGGTVYKLVKE